MDSIENVREPYSNTGKVRLQSSEVKMIDGKPHVLVREIYGRSSFWSCFQLSNGFEVEAT